MGSLTAQAQSSKPNILVIMPDDVGYWNVSAYHNGMMGRRTLNIDRLETDQKLAGLDSQNPPVRPNSDGSYTMWFGPKPPTGHEGNWIQQMPGKGYSVLLRLYGPLEPWFDKSWKPGDFEIVE
jgi:hypothetical protein